MRRENKFTHGARPHLKKEDKTMTELKSRKWITTCLVALLTFCLVLAGMFFFAPIKAEAWVGQTFKVNDINYIVLTEEEGNYTVKARSGAQSMNGNIPSQVYNESTGFYYTVVEIGNFQNTDLLNNLVIPETVTKIESYAFSNTWISNVVINGNPEIGSYAFSMSDVQSVEINGAPTFGEYVFDRCDKLTTVKFNSVDTNSSIQISDYMFNSCSALLSVTLSNNITSIGSNAFVICRALKTISSFPSSLVSIGSHAFGYCGSLKEITFSEGLETIGESAFAYSGLQGTLNLPNSLTTIGNSAFVNTKVTSVVIPKSVKTIGDYAFENCSSMTEITVYSKDVVWGKESLPITNLKQVYAHAGSTTQNYIDQFAATIKIDFFPIAAVGDKFIIDPIVYRVVTEGSGNNTVEVFDTTFEAYDRKVGEIVIPETVTYNSITYTVIGIKDSIDPGGGVFLYKMIDSIQLPDTLQYIGKYAFGSAEIETIVLPDSVTRIGEHAFDKAVIETIVLPKSLTSIEANAFYEASLTNGIELPNGLQTIGDRAFWGTDLVEITIPESVTSIGSGAFRSISKLEKLKILNPSLFLGRDLYFDDYDFKNLVVYGFPGSTAEQYCKTFGHQFSPFVEITWDLGGGAASIELPSGYYAVGDTVTIRQVALLGLEKTGYELSSITINGTSHSGNQLALILARGYSVEMPKEGLTIEIGWTGKEYTALFDQDGGTGGSPTSATVTYGSTYRLSNPVAPTKEGYRFEGYYFIDESGRVPVLVQFFNADMSPTRTVWNAAGNITLTAKWTPIVTSITIPTEKQSQTYYLGAEFVPFTITANLGDGTTQAVDVTEAMLTNFSTDTMGTRTATITYEGKTASFTYTVTGYAYKVEHYLQKITFDGYEATPWHTETLYGVGTTNAVARSYEGFTAKTVEQVNISEDGTSVVKVYYDKNAPTLTTNKYDLDDDGNYDEVYELASEWDLKWFAHTVNNGAANINGVLLNDIYLTADHIPIGINYIRGYADSITKYPFSGIFDGQGYAVYNIYKRVVTNNDSPGTALLGHSSSNGLFGLTQYATIRNVTVVGPYIHMDVANYITYNNVGGIAGEIIETVLENCHVKSGENEVAKGKGVISDGVGEVGYLEGQAKVVNGNFSTASIYVGGLVGKAAGNSVIKNCSTNFPGEKDFILRAYFINDIGRNLEGHERMGSFIGHAEYSVIENCYVERSRMMTALNYGSYVGQIAGYLGYCEVRNCFIYSEPVGRINGKSTIIENIYSLRDSSVFEDFDDTNDTNYSGQLYKVNLDDNSSISTATIQLKEGQIAPYGTTNLKEALNHGSANIDGAYSWAITESDTQFELVKPVLQGIAIPPEQTFAIGHYKPFEVTVTYAEGGQTIIYATTDMISGLDVNQLTQSAQTATVSYSLDGVTKTAQFNYTVVAGVAYTVNHYLLNVDSSVPSAWHETEVLLGFGETYAVSKEYPGFTPLEIEQQQIADDGSTVINVYYSRNTYKVTLVKNNFEITTPTETFNIVFGAQLPTDRTPTSVALGRIFMGYFEQDGGVGAQWFDSKMQPIKQIYDIPDNVTLYGYSVSCENHQWGEYTYVDGTNHQRKCTLCNKREDASEHFGAPATCQSVAICDACGSEYGSLGTHNYDMDEFGYQTADGHAHICTVDGCDEHDTVIPHTPNVDAATEDTAKYCTVDGCGFVIEQQLNHVHSEGTAWEHDSEYHWHDCVANDGQVYSKAAHTYDNACDTTCNGGCGYVRTITHDYSKLEKSDTQHWYICSVCGEEKANSRVGHSGGTETCQTLANCSTCGQAYGSLGDHDYDTTKWVSVDERSHAHKCKHCDSYTEQTGHFSEDDATCNEDKICDACGYKMADRLGHTYTKQIETSLYLKAEGEDCQSHHTYYYACVRCDASSKDDTDTFFEGTAVGSHKISAAWTTEYAQDTNAGSHYHECTVDGCDYKADEGDCTGGERTCIALAVCNTCQKSYGTYAEHTFGTAWDYRAMDGHAHVCAVNGCTAHDEIQAHTPNIPAATEDEAQVCEDCEYQMAPALGHTHSPTTSWTSNATHHWKACSGCSAHLDEAPHSYDVNNSCDADCNVCGYERSVTHDFTGVWQKDADGHWHVCENECGATDTKTNHVSAGAATETDPEVCSICGWEIASALGHITHTPEAEWKKNETHHWHECTGCEDQELDKDAHNDGNNDGSCDTCDYTFSAGTVVPGTDPINPSPDPEPQPPVDNPPMDDNEGLGVGAIVGIVLGSVAVVGGGGFALFWFVIRKKIKKPINSIEEPDNIDSLN